MPKKRVPVGPKLRFEVFKRDKFSCQYCGASSPDVMLHVDHLKPVKEGGSNDITNLITACADCNIGKGCRELSDDSAVKKQKKALDELQELRNQRELQRIWRDELAALEEDNLDDACGRMADEFPGLMLNYNGRKKMKKVLRQFEFCDVLDAIEIAGEQYLEMRGNVATAESLERALAKLGGICYNRANRGGASK